MRRIVPFLLASLSMAFAAKSMVFDAIGNQKAGVPFSITVRAMDNGSPITSYNYDGDLSVLPGGVVTPSSVSFVSGVATATVTITRRDKLQTQLRCVGKDPEAVLGTSNEFNVQAGPPERITLRTVFSAVTAGEPTATLIVAYADKDGNPVPGTSPVLTWYSTDKHATLPPVGTVYSVDTLTVTMRSGPDPFDPLEYSKHSIWPVVTGGGLRVDTLTNFRVNPAPFRRILIIAPGEVPDPGSTVGKTGAAQMNAYADTNFYFFAVDAFSNQVFATPNDQVTITANTKPEFYAAETVRLVASDAASDATPVKVSFSPPPSVAPLVYQYQGLDLTDPTKTDATLWPVIVLCRPNTIGLASAIDTIQIGQPLDLIARVSVKLGTQELGYPGDTVVFSVISGDPQVIDMPVTEVLSDINGYAQVAITGVVEGQVTIEARSRLADIATTKVITVRSKEPLTAFPNPFSRTRESTKILFVLTGDARSATLIISDLYGNIVLRKDYKEGDATKGANSYDWRGRNGKGELVATGVYVVRVVANLEHETFSQTRRLIVLP